MQSPKILPGLKRFAKPTQEGAEKAKRTYTFHLKLVMFFVYPFFLQLAYKVLVAKFSLPVFTYWEFVKLYFAAVIIVRLFRNK